MQTPLQMLIESLNKRIAELNAADKAFCYDRWENPQATQLMKMVAREQSNSVTFARQELQEQLKKATELLEKEREVIIGVAHYAFADALRPVSEQCSSFEDFYTKTFTNESK